MVSPALADNTLSLTNIVDNTHTQLPDPLDVFLTQVHVHWPSDDVKIQKCPTINWEHISCIRWNNRFFITGSDVVRVVAHRLMVRGRTVMNARKFEENVYADLRSMKEGEAFAVEDAFSEFLHFLHVNRCVRTQKRQRVFFWERVPFDQLVQDALDRDIRRQKDEKRSYIGYASNMNALNNYRKMMMARVTGVQQQLQHPEHQFDATMAPPTVERLPLPQQVQPASLRNIAMKKDQQLPMLDMAMNPMFQELPQFAYPMTMDMLPYGASMGMDGMTELYGGHSIPTVMVDDVSAMNDFQHNGNNFHIQYNGQMAPQYLQPMTSFYAANGQHMLEPMSPEVLLQNADPANITAGNIENILAQLQGQHDGNTPPQPQPLEQYVQADENGLVPMLMEYDFHATMENGEPKMQRPSIKRARAATLPYGPSKSGATQVREEDAAGGPMRRSQTMPVDVQETEVIAEWEESLLNEFIC
jgi:hypothetical protein